MRPFVSLRGRREFALVMRKGSVGSGAAATLYALSPHAPDRRPKVGVIVTKKVGNAVLRNRIRRRCKSALEKLLSPSDPRWYVIACKPAAATLPFAELSRQLAHAMSAHRQKRVRA